LWPPCLLFPIRRNAASTTRRVGRYFALGLPCATFSSCTFLFLPFVFVFAHSKTTEPILMRVMAHTTRFRARKCLFEVSSMTHNVWGRNLFEIQNRIFSGTPLPPNPSAPRSVDPHAYGAPRTPISFANPGAPLFGSHTYFFRKWSLQA